jgi:putative restriction endonuclease
MDRSHGAPAPHKPILLISVLQAFQAGLFTRPEIYLTAELVALFKSNWSLLVNTKHDCRISYPFYYMKSDKFWQLVPKPGFNNIEKIASTVKSFANLNAALECAIIDEDLFLLMKDEKSNRLLLQFLLDQYFPDTQNHFNYSNSGQLKMFDEIENKILKENSNSYRKEIKQLLEDKNEEEIFIRGSLFKREIPKIYLNTCCISGMKIDATINISMIDACHIVPFSESYDDTITNGIALCPNLHRAFDRGLIAISDDYEVLVKTNFVESNSAFSIHQFKNRKILLPSSKNYYPSLENLRHHRMRFNF